MSKLDTHMQGKICLVTGASSGIGKATALGLAQMGATVIMVCRDHEKGEAAQREIKMKSGNHAVDLLLADLSSQQSIRQLTERVQQRYSQVHVLINNAGALMSTRHETVDGLEMMFAVNQLAPFLLTNLLLDMIKASVPARIVNVSSSAHALGFVKLDLDDLQSEKRYGAMRAYGQSKLALVLFSYQLARRLQGTGVTVNCLHPGVLATNMMQHVPPGMRLPAKLIAVSPEKGASTSLYLASSPDVENITGKYFAKSAPRRSAPASYDGSLQQRVWEESAKLVRLPVKL